MDLYWKIKGICNIKRTNKITQKMLKESSGIIYYFGIIIPKETLLEYICNSIKRDIRKLKLKMVNNSFEPKLEKTIDVDFNFDKIHRTFFEKIIGKHFKINLKFFEYMENSKGILTYKDAVDYYNSQNKINEIEKIVLEKIKMQINSLEQKIRRIKEEYTDLLIILPPACDDEIERHSRLLTGNGFPPIPQGYAEFLKICNGYAFNCAELYGTGSVTQEGSSFTLLDIASFTIEMNKLYEEYGGLSGKTLLWFGSDVCGDHFITYDDKTGKYQRRSHECLSDVWEEYDTFEELFDKGM